MGEIRIGTSGWSYPGGEGTWSAIYESDEGPGELDPRCQAILDGETPDLGGDDGTTDPDAGV